MQPGICTWANPLRGQSQAQIVVHPVLEQQIHFSLFAFCFFFFFFFSSSSPDFLFNLLPPHRHSFGPRHPTVHSPYPLFRLSRCWQHSLFVYSTVFTPQPLRDTASQPPSLTLRYTYDNNHNNQQPSTHRLYAIHITIAIMKSAIFTASLLASAALAHQHQHARHHNKRQNDVVWVTDYDYVTEIVGLTTTYWVSAGEEVTATYHQNPTLSPPASTSDAAPQFFQSSSAAAAPAPQSTTTVAAAPAPVVTSSAAPPPPPPATTTTTTTTTSVPPPPPAPTTLVTSTTSAAPPPPASSSTAPSSGGGSSSGGQCSEGSPCSGDITYYDTGLGACGITSTDDQNVVALPYEFMGTQSNGNPYCGRTIAITCDTTGKTSTATVVDKCMGCTGMSIDLSPAVFNELASESVGRTTASWYFTD